MKTVRGIAILTGAFAATSGAWSMTAADAVAGMAKTWNSISAYSCTMDVVSRRGEETLHQGFVYDFRKPRLVRLKVTVDPNKGADVVYDQRGKIHAAKRVLGIRFKQSMDVNDPMFRDLRDNPFWKADLGSQIAEIHRTLALPGATGSVTAAREGRAAVLILVVRYHEEGARLRGGRHDFVDTWNLDGTTYFPLHRTLAEDGTTVEDVTVTNVNLSAVLPDSLFHL